ncbi:ATP-binding protein [Fusibacter sp. JL216-2]|uniref:ATP-binding protein n=1 Tax=Fusibacter sp. JL216-2 TaxID=3071453 RepID=UPI003D32731D
MDCKWLLETSVPVLQLKQEASALVIELCNDAFSNLVNLDSNDLIGMTIQDIVAQNDHLTWLDRYRNTSLALIEVNQKWFEVEIIKSEGLVAYVHHNITPQVELDSSNKDLRTRLNQIQTLAKIGDWEHNFKTGIEFWSDEVYKIMGFKDKTIQPNLETFMRFIHPDDFEEVEESHKAIQEGKGYTVEFRIITIEGETKWVVTQAKVDLDENGFPMRVYGTMQDITERKRLEKRVEQAFTVAEDAHQTKSQFLATISHEVRTPINGILGMSQLLKGSNLDEEQSEYVDDIMFSADALLNIIEDILEMSKMESNILEADMEEFDLHVLLRNIVRMYQLKKHGKAIHFLHRIDPKIPQYVWGDATKIQQILINILGNAFKFTEQGRISLTVKVLEDDINQCKIAFEVEDTGIGISAEMQKDIFNRFHQGDPNIQNRYGGSGLGLAISKNYAELMKGYLLVESELDRGSKFTLALSLEKANKLDSDKDVSVFHSKIKAMHVRVLAVVDDEMSRNHLKSILVERCGFKVDFAEDLNSVIQAFEHNTYQFLVMDTFLTDQSDVYIARTIRESLKMDGLTLPIIAVTGDGKEENKKALIKAGVNHLIEKPVNESVFMEIIHQILDVSAVKRRSKSRPGYRYIKVDQLGRKRLEIGKQVFENGINATISGSQDKVSKILSASAPLNILVLSHEIDEIDDVISNFGTEDICESLELIKSALLNDDTVGIEVIVTDFMDEYQCFVDELQEFINDLPAGA